MCFSQPSTPALPPAPPNVQVAAQNETKRRLAAAGRKSTIITGGKGLVDEAPTTKKSLLGY